MIMIVQLDVVRGLSISEDKAMSGGWLNFVQTFVIDKHDGELSGCVIKPKTKGVTQRGNQMKKIHESG